MKLARVLALALVVLGTILGGALGIGCGASGSTTATSCATDDFRQCDCPTFVQTGTQACIDGSWAPCTCSSLDDAGADAAPDGPGVCGDETCSGSETCANCPADCGTCPACTYAPTCTGANSPPSSPTAEASFNNAGQAMYTSGVGFGDPNDLSVCSYPLLKMRVSDIVVHKNGAPGSLEMFCMVQADDGQSSALMVSPDYTNISDNNPPLILSPAQGTFWGESAGTDGGPIGVKLSQFNITVTYQCFMVLQPGALQAALGAIANFAGAAASIPGNPYGWAFGIGGAAAAAAAAATAIGNGAVQLFSVQQIIDSGALLKLTNGYTWTIEQTGSTQAQGDCGFFGSCDWDWQLDVEAWGCAAPKGEVPMTM
jgi:hypothetical protein